MTELSRRAPAVQYPLGRSRLLGVVLGTLLVAGAGLLVAWVWQGVQSPSQGWAATAGAGVWLAAASGALHFWWRQFSGKLCWDGQTWVLEGDQRGRTAWVLDGPPVVHLDLQAHLWVRASLPGRRCIWLWLERSSQPQRWMDLRRAVYSRATPGAARAVENVSAHSRRA